MSKRFGHLIPQILNGTKKIESRWSKYKIAPWDKIHPKDIIYFKNSGGPILAKAKVSKVIQFQDLNKEKIKYIIDKYGRKGNIALKNTNPDSEGYKNKNYCVLIFLKDSQKIEPFKIDKTGFGTGAAWMCAEDISRVRV